MTPMMQQYLLVKEEYRDHILFYRLGDFYEMFFDDAKTASRELELTLTGRDCGEEERAPMCGVPYHSVEPYIAKLVSRGYKVAICEQTEDPALAKGIVKREVVRVITPGTVTDGSMLSEDKNNYIGSIYIANDGAAVCFADISTGYITVCESTGEDSQRFAVNELCCFMPKEIITSFPLSSMPLIKSCITERLSCTVNDGQASRFGEMSCAAVCKKQFPPEDLKELKPAALCAVGACLDYIIETQKTDISYIDRLSVYESDRCLLIDANSRRSLELCESMRTGARRGTLLWVLDEAKTSLGRRLLRKWVEMPLASLPEIQHRQDAVEDLFGDYILREELMEELKYVKDLERLASRLVYETANARDLRAISSTASHLPAIRNLISGCPSEYMRKIFASLDTLEDICRLIDGAICDEPPFSVREGDFIRDGYSADVDRLRSIMKDSKHWLNQLEAAERDATGIKNLKVAYNRVFGYYIEVTRSQLSLVPDRYIRKQTLTGCERFITEELKELEASLLGASDKIKTLEYEIFRDIRDRLCRDIYRIRTSAECVAKTDAILSLASVAYKNNYVRPEVDLSDVIYIKDGRHPVVERVSDGGFVPNDTYLDSGHNRLMLITGPNMAGKSTYMRQVALTVIMAQLGSFVPASEARIGLTDRIFTRVGASDDLASGTSTFMLEMTEVAAILKGATKRSLILYDEIGRGTSTYDGMSIARAVAEYTAEKIGARTMLATHYHELTELEGSIEGAINYNIAAKKRGDDIIFLRKILRGGTDESYGVEVARLAGVPRPVIRRARELLASLVAAAPEMERARKKTDIDTLNVSMEDLSNDEIRRVLTAVDLNVTNPLEAYDILRKLKGLL